MFRVKSEQGIEILLRATEQAKQLTQAFITIMPGHPLFKFCRIVVYDPSPHYNVYSSWLYFF